MERTYLLGEVYTLARPRGAVRFVKILGPGRNTIWVRPFARPPVFRWDMRPGVPTLLADPEQGDEAAGPGVRVLSLSIDDFMSAGPQFSARTAVSAEELDALNETVLAGVPVISAELLDQLMKVEPSRDRDLEYRPCRVRLRNGQGVDRVYVVEASAFIRSWGVWPEHDRGKASVAIQDVAHIEESPSRLPARLATKMYEAGESGMGYCRFVLVLEDGRRVPCVTGGAVDFVDLPNGVTPASVVDLIPHQGRDHGEDPPADRAPTTSAQPGYAWCLYRLEHRS